MVDHAVKYDRSCCERSCCDEYSWCRLVNVTHDMPKLRAMRWVRVNAILPFQAHMGDGAHDKQAWVICYTAGRGSRNMSDGAPGRNMSDRAPGRNMSDGAPGRLRPRPEY